MRSTHYRQLLATARRLASRPDEAEDLVQDALLEVVRTGRDPADLAYLRGIIRNKARMAARTASRRRGREAQWQGLRADAGQGDAMDIAALVANLPPSLKSIAALALSGHDRREIAYLLRLSDTALRQRLSALKRQLLRQGVPMPQGTPGLGLDLNYGRIRDALLSGLLRQGGIFASHDPDGHFFIVSRSQIGPARQQGPTNPKEDSP